MTFTAVQELEADLLQSELVRILGLKKLPYSEDDKAVLRKGVELLRAIQEDIISPRVRVWNAQYLGKDEASGPRGSRAMAFFSLGELECKDKLTVMAMTLDHAIDHGGMRPEAHMRLYKFFLQPQIPVP